MTALTAAELHQLISGASNGFEEVDAGHVKVMVRGVTVREYLIQVVRRFPSVRALFTMGASAEAEFALAVAKARRDADELGEPFDLDSFTREYVPSASQADFVDAQIGSGPEANAAFIACGLGHPGDEAVEKLILQMPDELHDAILSGIERLTYGGDPKRFFGRVGEELAGTMGRAMRASIVGQEATSSAS